VIPPAAATTALDARTEGETTKMNWTLEVVIVPVSDVDRAKAFYADQLGFNVDHDTKISDGNRIVQLTPPGSGCSIVVGEGVVPKMAPGSLKGLQLVVPDIQAARAELAERGVEVGEVQVVGENPRPEPDPLDNVGFVFFDDPDGNSWAVQQISARG
jgi:catechol 2,3-dioxygenase-like lactoylglutathione lyase family enzyme